MRDLDFEQCYRAVQSRDARFDGRFVTCATSTGIYCRPSCPALTPKRSNVRFLPSAAAAQLAGFRACLRCQPDAVPGDPQWSYRADIAGRAMRLIADGVVDREGVSGLAARIGYTPRHLSRLLVAEVGAGPLALARAQRAHTARLLVETTTMGLADIAFAAGFGSVRQFNDTMRQTYGRSPSELRQARRPSPSPGPGDSGLFGGLGVIRVRLPYREPLHTAALLEFLAARTIPGVDEVVDDRYRRGLRLPHGPAVVELAIRPGHVDARLHLADVRDLAPAVARCRRLLDLDADPIAADALLALDPALAPAVAKEPGVRVPGAVDGFEIAVRAVVGQQISVTGARSVLRRLVTACAPSGVDIPTGERGRPADVPGDREAEPYAYARPLRAFPEPAQVAEAPDEAFAMPAARRRTLRALATAVAEGRLALGPGADRDEAYARLSEIPGIGPWTAQYLGLRALGDPDVLMTTDLGVRRGAAAAGLPDEPTALAGHGLAHWAPWRSYATVRLWRMATAHPGRVVRRPGGQAATIQQRGRRSRVTGAADRPE
ncbi:MAG: DNA-3-methyladenine glycosylase 2 family protein [Micromonosporaceae bacterium]|nr:DNA-3-methyladenine glycosylase 2 family protein [Micromonosporaceae bacterium]